MMDVVPFMILTAVVVVAVAGWGYLRAERSGIRPEDAWEPAADVEAMFLDCLASKGVAIPDLRVYRDPTGLVIVGPDELNAPARAALSECDEQIVAALAELPRGD